MINLDEIKALESVVSRPCVVAQWLTFRLHSHIKQGQLPHPLLKCVEQNISEFTSAWMACEKIQKTPVPFPHVQVIHFSLLAFLASMPFTIAHLFAWGTPVAALVVSFVFLGINEASASVESPFATDTHNENVLPLDGYGEELRADSLW